MGNIADKVFARSRNIKYNYNDGEKRARVETYDNTVHDGLVRDLAGERVSVLYM